MKISAADEDSYSALYNKLRQRLVFTIIDWDLTQAEAAKRLLVSRAFLIECLIPWGSDLL
jgi:hypothetical protein